MRLASDNDGTLVDCWLVTVPPPQTEQSDCSYVTEEEEEEEPPSRCQHGSVTTVWADQRSGHSF